MKRAAQTMSLFTLAGGAFATGEQAVFASYGIPAVDQGVAGDPTWIHPQRPQGRPIVGTDWSANPDNAEFSDKEHS
jgi:hypothetical protein